MLLVVVNYNNEAEVVGYLQAVLQGQTAPPQYIYIVNNQCRNIALLQQFAHNHPTVTLLDINENIGYLPAAYRAFTHYHDKHGIPNIFILCNTDITIPDAHFFEKLSQQYTNSNYALIGPDILAAETGKHQNPMYRSRLAKAKINRLIGLFGNYTIYRLYSWMAGIKPASVAPPNSGQVYAVHGSFIVCTSLFFENGGTLNYPMFLFGEELFLAEQCHAKGLPVYFDNALKIVHHEHSTTGLMKKEKVLALRSSLQYILRTFYA